MASLTIRKLDDSVKAKLRVRAAEHGRSMEEEVRRFWRGRFRFRCLRLLWGSHAASISRSGAAWLMQGVDGIDLEIPPRGPCGHSPTSAAPNFEPATMNSR